MNANIEKGFRPRYFTAESIETRPAFRELLFGGNRKHFNAVDRIGGGLAVPLRELCGQDP
jgi:hypothetical protein